MDKKKLLNLAFELGVLSRTPRSGPYHVGITDQVTSAAHSYRASVLAYFIAREEKADIGKVLRMCLVHDMPEARLLNQTFIQKKEFSLKDKEAAALEKQLRKLDGSEELVQAFREYIEGKTPEARVVLDATLLEALVEAKEYLQLGLEAMRVWFQGKRESLQTDTAREILETLEKETIEWWKDLDG